MTRTEIRQALKSKHGAITAAAEAAGCSKQHLSNFLAGSGDALSAGPMLRLVDHLRTVHGLDVDIEVLMRDSMGIERAEPAEASA